MDSRQYKRPLNSSVVRHTLRLRSCLLPVIAVNVALAQIKMDASSCVVKDSLARWDLQPSDLELDVIEFILARTTLAQSDVLVNMSSKAKGQGISSVTPCAPRTPLRSCVLA